MPFTDPMADGPAIQAAGVRALAAGQNTEKDACTGARIPRGRRRHPDRADGLLQSDLHLRRRQIPRRRQGGRRRRAYRRRSAAGRRRRALHPGAQSRAQFHPPGDADHRRQAPAGGAQQYLGLCLLRLDHRHHRRGRARRRAKSTAAVARIKRHTKLPVAVGFGVRTAEQARAIAARRRRRRGRLGAGRGGARTASTKTAKRGPARSRRSPIWCRRSRKGVRAARRVAAE